MGIRYGSPVQSPSAVVPAPSSRRHTGAFTSHSSARRYWVLLTVILAVGFACAFGLLAYGNPLPVGSEGFWLIAQRRMKAVIAIVLVAACQGMATVAFQTVTNNRIVTPSILGFESLYRAIHTTMVFAFGAAGIVATQNTQSFLLQLLVMVGLSLVLYSWLLGNGARNMHAMLLVGIVIGGGLGSLSTFMQRLLTPSEFDLLTARLFGSVSNANAAYFPVAIPLVAVGTAALYVLSRRLNVLALGREAATNLGVNYRWTAIGVLVLVSVLMATSTALVGPMTFFGFLVATLAYQFSATHDHRFIFPMAFALGFAVLSSAYFVLNHVFYAQGVVGVIIELVGGLTFLIVILRKGRL